MGVVLMAQHVMNACHTTDKGVTEPLWAQDGVWNTGDQALHVWEFEEKFSIINDRSCELNSKDLLDSIITLYTTIRFEGINFQGNSKIHRTVNFIILKTFLVHSSQLLDDEASVSLSLVQ